MLKNRKQAAVSKGFKLNEQTDYAGITENMRETSGDVRTQIPINRRKIQDRTCQCTFLAKVILIIIPASVESFLDTVIVIIISDDQPKYFVLFTSFHHDFMQLLQENPQVATTK
jgi:hypothetical protein